MVPKNFKYGMEIGIVLASQYYEGLGQGIRHFSAETKQELLTVKKILEEISENECVIVWSKEMGEGTLGLTIFSEDGQATGVLVGMHPDIAKILFKEE